MHVRIANPRWRGRRSRHSRRMRNPQFFVSGKRPMASLDHKRLILQHMCLINFVIFQQLLAVSYAPCNLYLCVSSWAGRFSNLKYIYVTCIPHMSREQWNMNKQRSSLITILSFFMITIFLFKDIRQKSLTSLNAQTSGNVYLLRVSHSDAKKYRTVVKSNSTRLNMRQCKLCRAKDRMTSINSSDLSPLISVSRVYSTPRRRQFTQKDQEYQLRKFVDLSAADFVQWKGSPLPHNWSNVEGDGNFFVDINFKVIIPDSKVHGAHLGPTGPSWAPCWPHELCYLGRLLTKDNRELPWCQCCRHWYHRRLSLWQPPMQQEETKLASYPFRFQWMCRESWEWLSVFLSVIVA